MTDGEGVDVVLDSVGGETFEESFKATKPYGRIVTLIQYPADTNWSVARIKNLNTSMELMLAPPFLGLKSQRLEQTEILKRCGEYFADGRLKIEVATELPLSEVIKAHEMIEQGGLKGKIVLKT